MGAECPFDRYQYCGEVDFIARFGLFAVAGAAKTWGGEDGMDKAMGADSHLWSLTLTGHCHSLLYNDILPINPR